jgi:hypothetical protein
MARDEDVELRLLNTAVIEESLAGLNLEALRREVAFDPAYEFLGHDRRSVPPTLLYSGSPLPSRFSWLYFDRSL